MLKTNLEGCFSKIYYLFSQKLTKKNWGFETYETPHQIKKKKKKKKKKFWKKTKSLEKKKNTKKKN